MKLVSVRTGFVLGAVACGVALPGCAGAPTSTPDPTAPAPTVVATPVSEPCADPVVSARVDEALASQTEGSHNGILLSPDEVREQGFDEEAVAQQSAAWAALTAQDRAFQQCLRARQGEKPAADE